MVARCCVPLCRSNSKQVKLYIIPKNLIRRKQYANAIKRPNWIPNDADRICEVSFLKIVMYRYGTAQFAGKFNFFP